MLVLFRSNRPLSTAAAAASAAVAAVWRDPTRSAVGRPPFRRKESSEERPSDNKTKRLPSVCETGGFLDFPEKKVREREERGETASRQRRKSHQGADDRDLYDIHNTYIELAAGKGHRRVCRMLD